MNSITCPKCKSSGVVKRGFTPTSERGKQQRYLCKSCKHAFLLDAGFWKMKNKAEMVTMAVDMYLSNLSSRHMRNQLWRHFRVKVSHVTILNWVRKYVRKVSGFLRQQRLNLTGKAYVDETEIGRDDKKGVLWCSVDWDSRFISASLYSPREQNMDDAVAFLRRVKENGRPCRIQTDGLLMYPRAIKKVFYSRYKERWVEHKALNFTETKKYNVRIETVFSKLKDRIADFRGIKSRKTALLVEGIIIQHNYIERHSTTGKVPCELAGMDLGLGDDRWMGLIGMASSR
jgi:transposase-like protein